jgi:hypothetical protein
MENHWSLLLFLPSIYIYISGTCSWETTSAPRGKSKPLQHVITSIQPPFLVPLRTTQQLILQTPKGRPMSK